MQYYLSEVIQWWDSIPSWWIFRCITYLIESKSLRKMKKWQSLSLKWAGLSTFYLSINRRIKMHQIKWSKFS